MLLLLMGRSFEADSLSHSSPEPLPELTIGHRPADIGISADGPTGRRGVGKGIPEQQRPVVFQAVRHLHGFAGGIVSRPHIPGTPAKALAVMPRI
jgi:hypothetical protein